jgi:predicted amidohydrolase
MISIASIQMVSAQNVADNLATAERLINQAVLGGATIILLPEFFALIASNEERLAQSEPFCPQPLMPGAPPAPIQHFLARLAHAHQVWLIGGSVPITSHEAGKVWNALLAFNPQGECVLRYDKIHLFGFQQGQESYEERRFISAGNLQQPLGFNIANLGNLKMGASICYDLRFPEHFQQIASQLGGMDILMLPAAFTYTTGKDHWEILLRARAIENQCFVLASAQGGIHDNGRRTFGHSMVIDPWGKVLACVPEGEGIAIAEFNSERLAEIRGQLPALAHRRWGQH